MSSYTHLINFVTSSNIIYSGNYASSLVLTQPDTDGSFLKVTSGGAGVLSISDTEETSETMTFSSSRFKLSAYAYVPTLAITCSGYTGTVTLSIESVDLSGNPIYLSSVSTNYPCRFTKVRQIGVTDQTLLENLGEVNKNIYMVRCPKLISASTGDEFTIGNIAGTTFKIISDPNNYTNVRSNVQIEKSFKAVKIKEE